jgi:hypothetical protein
MSKIINSLESNSTLQILNLSWNNIPAEINLQPLSRFIRSNTDLIHLDMSKTLQTSEQITYLIKSIKKSVSL